MSIPSSAKRRRRKATLLHSRARSCGSFSTMLARPPAARRRPGRGQVAGEEARAAERVRRSRSGPATPQTKPPWPPRLLEKVPRWKSTSVVEAEVLGHAAAVGAEQERGVRLVDEDARAVALGHLDDLGQHADVAVHGVDALHHHQLLARGRRSSLRSRSSGLLWRKKTVLDLARMAPSTMEACEYWSQKMWSPERMSAEMKPTLALYPVGNRMAASLSLKPATAFASSLWMSKVPAQDGRAGGAQAVLPRGLDGRLLDLVAVGDARGSCRTPG